MAKIIVEIEIANPAFEALVADIFDEQSDWYDAEDPGMIIIDEAYLKRAKCDDSFYAFKLIGIKS